MVIVTTGLVWILAAIGVFLRDVGQTIGIITAVLMFLSPVFYPVTAVPERFRPFIMANPLTFIIEQSREVLVWGHMPDWQGLSLNLSGFFLLPGQVLLMYFNTENDYSMQLFLRDFCSEYAQN